MKRKDPFSVTAKQELTVAPRSTIRMSGITPPKPAPKHKPHTHKKKKKVVVAPKKFVIKNEFLDIAKAQGIVKSAAPTTPLKGLPGEFNIDRLARFNVTYDVKGTDIKGIDELQVPMKMSLPQRGAKAPGNIVFLDPKRNFYGYDSTRWWPFIQGIADVLEFNNNAGGYDIFNLGDVYAQNFVGNQVSVERINYPTSAINPNVNVSIIDSGLAGNFNYANLISTERPFVASNVRGTGIKLNDKNEVAAVGITDNSPVVFYNGTTLASATLTVDPIFGITSSYVVKYDSSGNYEWSTFISGVDANNLPSIGFNKFNDVVTCGVYNTDVVNFYSTDNLTTPSYTLAPLNAESAYLARYNYAGVFQWATRLSGTSLTDATELAREVVINDLGDILIVGSFDTSELAIYAPNTDTVVSTLGNPFGGTNGYLVKFNKAGTFQWATLLAGSAAGVISAYGVDVNENGDVVVCGAFDTSELSVYNVGGMAIVATMPLLGGARENFLVKYDSAGSFQWVTGVAGFVDIPQVSINESGNIVLSIWGTSTITPYAIDIYAAGGTSLATTLSGYSTSNAFIVKYNENGTYLSKTVISNVSPGYPLDITINDINRIVITGGFTANLDIYNSGGKSVRAQLANIGGSDVFVIVYDSVLTYQWATLIAGIEDDQAFGASLNNVNALALTGYYSQLANIYDGNGNNVGFLPTKLNGTDAFVVRFTDELSVLSLPNPALDGQQKLIISTGPDVLIVPVATVDGLIQNLELSANQYVQLLWDAGQLNWNTLYNTGEGLVLGGNLNLNGFDIVNVDNIDAQEIDVLNMTVENNLFVENVIADNVSASLVVGNFSSLQRLNYPDTTISTETLYTIVESGEPGFVEWGSINTGFNFGGLSINNNPDIVNVGTYQSAAFDAYNYGGIVIGATLPYSSTNAAYIVKYNYEGIVTWAANILSPNSQGTRVSINNTDLVVVGLYESIATIYDAGGLIPRFTLDAPAGAHSFVVKYNLQGAAQSATKIVNALVEDVVLNLNGDAIATGSYTDPIIIYNPGNITAFTLPFSGESDAFIVKYDYAGNSEWVSRIAGINIDSGISISSNGQDILVTGAYYIDPITIYSSGGTLAQFTLASSGINGDSFIVKYNSSGYPVWVNRIGNHYYSDKNRIYVNNNSISAVTGLFNSVIDIYDVGGTLIAYTLGSNGNIEAFVIKYNSLGSPEWNLKIGNPINQTTGTDISINDTEDITVIGNYDNGDLYVLAPMSTIQQYTLPNSGITNTFIVRFNSNGFANWASRIGGNFVAGYGLSVNKYNDFVISGVKDANPIYAYNSGGITIQYTLPGIGSDSAYMVKYSQLTRAQLPDPTVDGQPKTITSVGPQVIIEGTTINNVTTTLQIYNGDSVKLVWDAVRQTWLNEDNTILIDSGTVSQPSLSFINDSDTGIFSPANNIIALSTGGTEKLRVSENGYICIGTSDPICKLNVNSGNILIGTGVNDWTSSTSYYIGRNQYDTQFQNSGFSGIQFGGPSSAGGGYLAFHVHLYGSGSGEAIRIDPFGNVGIGTQVPTVKLEVQDANPNATDIRVSNTSPGGRSYVMSSTGSSNSSGAGNFSIYDEGVGGGFRFVINSSGNIGIGTTNPAYKLDVVGQAGLSTGTAWINTCDERLKDIHGIFDKGLREILELTPIRYTYKRDNPLAIPSDFEKIGFSAQQVQQVIPEAVSTDSRGYLQLNVDPIHWASINAIKELHRELKTMREELEILKSENAKLKLQISEKF